MPTGDVVLDAEVCGAVLLPDLVPEQHVGIYVNNLPVGEWVFNAYGSSKREVIIPKQAFEQGSIALQFRPARPISVIKYHLADSPYELGLYVVSLQLHPVSEEKK